ncbi:uncharacterized protein LOC116916657 isoform X3 [Daphnia magna]|uniref:uncharacterized protein LOC116916657 isoform X3 n=1 Tax=Daphnia magna TaxID=35525 RepID=UPI001E1BA405|nr:uncharacterized protein LOC116916657 isoform X3 [Daphnia magna]
MAEKGRRTLEEGAPLIKQPKETTSIGKEIREPVRQGHDCKLFCICTGKENNVSKYLYISHFPKKENKRPIYKGYYNCDVPVAIVRIDPIHSGTTKTEIDRELLILKELELHENFIRYFIHEENENFVFIATELCLCSVADLLDPALEGKIPMADKIREELRAKEILRQATNGLNYLHQNNFVHRNIKPNNFLIKEINKTGNSTCRFAVKITDFRLTRKLDLHKSSQSSGSAASEGWEAPESRKKEEDLNPKMDVFILGCFYHYVLIALSKNEVNKRKPRHPFGDDEFLRPRYITQENYSVYKGQLPFVPSDTEEERVVELMKKMLEFKEKDRPTLQEILENSYFKPCEDYKIYDNEDKTKKPGLCVIFNQKIFKDSNQNREGSDQDRDALNVTFNGLGFDTKVHENLASFDVKNEIENLAKGDFNDYGCLIVCFLSHGIENAILCYDGRHVNTNELKYKFSLGNCPSLYGKPKIFIIQACQGYLEQSQTGILSGKQRRRRSLPNLQDLHLIDQQESSGSTVQLTNKDTKHTYEIEELKKLKIWDYAKKNPPLMDFLTINATLPGFVSYRHIYYGTFFVQALCKTLDEEYSGKKPVDGTNHMDLEGVLRRVQLNINRIYPRQTLLWEACLSKYIRFRGVETKDIDLTSSNWKGDSVSS